MLLLCTFVALFITDSTPDVCCRGVTGVGGGGGGGAAAGCGVCGTGKCKCLFGDIMAVIALDVTLEFIILLVGCCCCCCCCSC